MKFDLAKVSLALMSAVFILGCQDQGSGVVGPDGLSPQFAKKDKNCVTPPLHKSCKDEDPPLPSDDATYTATFQTLENCDGAVGPPCDVTGTTDNLFPPQGGKELMLSDHRFPVLLTRTDFLQTAVGYSGDDLRGDI